MQKAKVRPPKNLQAARHSLVKQQISTPISFPTRSNPSIAPPKKVIKALYDYQSQGPQELSFSQGDFFHVTGRENDKAWYEACNPATNSRGLVPVSYFQVLEKAQPTLIDAVPAGQHKSDSGFVDNDAPPPKNKMQPLYGIVLYNFDAQRPDELQAKAGEPIIVIAQSNLEWFVAKPIGRLGGPGLIPVSFVEIKDAITGRTITNVTDLMQKAAPPIPKVEEWKKMTQGYEESSISLGRLETGPPKRPAEPGTMPVTSPTGSQSGSHHEEYYYDDQSYTQDYPDEESYREDPYAPGLDDDESGYGQPHNRDDILDSYGDRDLERTSSDSTTLPNARSGPARHFNSPVVSASVDSYNLVDDQYWFIVTVDLADGRQRMLYRLYEDFYEFQISLLNRFPEEAGRTGEPRILPFMPGPVNVITEMVTKQRQIDLDTYVKELCALPDYIVQSDLVEDQLFGIHDGDVETEGRHHQKNKSSTSSNSRGSSPPPSSYKKQQQQRQGADAAPSKSSTRDYQDRNDRYDRYRDDQYDDRGSGGPMPSASTSSHAGPSIKVKIIHRDEIIAIKVSANSTFADLCDKIYDRLGIDATLMYRDERKGTRMPLGSERDMEKAMSSASQSGKLMVYAD
ncbi:hypothetical protein BC937DRAFT_91011 [Endogone sp. FLAS-F59071]|nr:hypothetical protein BC937DRAFT_91011 [Endogone sp. FLAS-F59071]|eukprot:RUS16603.1 hypothetical protein BC937DRAFT_91011 [Endogone sp. FLAS-F59071]